jgi:pimeloyl-ACP methyl ester carboxylesterase
MEKIPTDSFAHTNTPAQLEMTQGHDGLRLAQERFQADSVSKRALPTILFAHGFGQNRLSWRASAERLVTLGYTCLALDGRGHGDSAWSAAGNYELDDFVWDVLATASIQTQRTGLKPILIGASMGGLLGLLSETENKDNGAYSALILVDVTPRWEAQGVSRIFEFMSAHPNGFTSVEEASLAVAQYLPHRDSKNPERLRAHLRSGADGRLRWHWDPRLLEHIPRASERYFPRLEAAASKVRCPVLLLSGGKSDVVSERTIQSFQMLVPHAEHRQIPDATHMIVGDRNDLFGAEIEDFLARIIPIPALNKDSL